MSIKPTNLAVIHHTFPYLTEKEQRMLPSLSKAHHAHVSYHLFLQLIAKINKKGKGDLCFPPFKVFEKLSMDALHEIWTNNNCTLIGLIASCKIPGFGVHGTKWQSLCQIVKTKESRNLWIPAPLFIMCHGSDQMPIKRLADAYAATQKASNYGSNGGVLIVRAPSYNSIQKCSDCARKSMDEPFRCFPSLTKDSPAQKKFLSLIHRRDLHPTVGEGFCGFTPENYHTQVFGPILATLYTDQQKAKLYTFTDSAASQRLTYFQRIKVQELLVRIFWITGALENLDQSFFEIGSKQMQEIDNWGISKEEWDLLVGLGPKADPREAWGY